MAKKVYRDGREKLTGVDYAEAKKEKWEEQGRTCALCGFYVSLASGDVDHIRTKGMGGSKHDDRPENLRIVHRTCHILRHHRERDAKASWDKKVNSIVEWAEGRGSDAVAPKVGRP